MYIYIHIVEYWKRLWILQLSFRKVLNQIIKEHLQQQSSHLICSTFLYALYSTQLHVMRITWRLARLRCTFLAVAHRLQLGQGAINQKKNISSSRAFRLRIKVHAQNGDLEETVMHASGCSSSFIACIKGLNQKKEQLQQQSSCLTRRMLTPVKQFSRCAQRKRKNKKLNYSRLILLTLRKVSRTLGIVLQQNCKEIFF